MAAIEARRILSALQHSEFVVHGRNCHLFVFEAGQAEISINRDLHILSGIGLLWLPIGSQATITIRAGTRGWQLKVPELMLASSIPHRTLGSYIREMVSNFALLELDCKSDTEKLVYILSVMETELRDNSLASQTLLELSLSMALIELWRKMGRDISSHQPAPRNILRSFLHLASLHLRSHWTIDKYAEVLGVPRDRLHSEVLKATGTSPKKYVNSLMMREARSLLEQPDLQVAEVAYKLGFSDAAYFNRFFQRHEGISPGAYRRSFLERQEEQSSSYAAWP